VPPASPRARSCSEGDEGGSGGDSEADGGDGVDDYLCAKMHLVSLFFFASDVFCTHQCMFTDMHSVFGNGIDDYLCAKMHLMSLFVIAFVVFCTNHRMICARAPTDCGDGVDATCAPRCTW